MTGFTDLVALLEDAKLPPVQQWRPQKTGEIDICIKQNGEWIHEGTVIQRPALVKLFASILRIDAGEYFLVTPAEKLRVDIEDVPFVAVEMQQQCNTEDESQLQIAFRTNVDDVVIASENNQIFLNCTVSGQMKPYIHIRNGLNARIERSVYYELAEWVRPCVKNPALLGVYSGGFFHELSHDPGATKK